MALTNARSLAGRLRSLGFQSKLLVMMLVVSVGSALVAGIIGYTFGTTSLRDSEYQRLTQLRESRNREIKAFYGGISDAATVLTHAGTTISAVKDFERAFADLQETLLPPGAVETVRDYYDTVFGPRLTEVTGVQADPQLYQPHLQCANLPAECLYGPRQRRLGRSDQHPVGRGPERMVGAPRPLPAVLR